MEEHQGLPMLGTVAIRLGIRRDVDIVPDAQDLVHRPAFLPKGKNGLSCVPTISDFPLFALPVVWGGSNKKTVLWRIDPADLGPEIMAQEDSPPGRRRHISIGPARTMTFQHFFELIEATRSHWQKVI
jgi:hypothetical protein